ncbi:zinc finger protein 62 homolog isoform X3 [Frankliniella occidentalis]|uniref:Zinc finger protein 62 homolog isoform X3 n=1 Tax=Frankliniella occidentalis TaxID=133901 RepID=A0A6J1SSY4_FRAOC|nr:zinc finger protein 62 homolog isoform X3 [Frankliniella occidentalis]
MEDLEAGLSNLCRLCGEVDVECSNLFDETEQEENLLSKIQLSIRIAISQDDGLPSGICNACRDKLVDYTSFYQQCHDTQERLQEFLCIESAMQKTIHADPPEIKFEAVTEHEDEADDFYYEDAEGGADENVDDENVEYMETEENNEIPEEEEYILADTEKDRRNEEERLLSSPVSIIVEDLENDTITDNFDETVQVDHSEILPGSPRKKLVYLIKNAGNMPVQTVLSAVLGNQESNSSRGKSLLAPLRKTPTGKTQNSKHPPDNKLSQKVVIKGSDGKENMILLDVPVPLNMVATEIQENSEDVDDPTWAPPSSENTSKRKSSWSKLKRARTAVRNSMKILRLPKPRNKRESRAERPLRTPVRKQAPISKDDPNYAIMMEKFAKPVSISTLKRHGLYQPKPNGYKINAPYKKDVAPYIEKVSDTEFKCKICLSAKFRWNYKAEIHILEHLDWRPFECDVCGRSFTQNQYLTKHKRLHFPDDTNFMCEVCGKGFQRRYYLTYHMDEHFDRTYSCEDCGRKFTRRQKHDEHVRYHHKCHYSICDICGQTLRTTALSRHRKQHGEKSQGRKKRESAASSGTSQSTWLACGVCGRAFRSLRERDDHEAEHNNPLLPFQCEQCVVYFKSKRTLNNHIMHTHSQIGEEECEVATQEEECDDASQVLDELSSTIVVSIPGEI